MAVLSWVGAVPLVAAVLAAADRTRQEFATRGFEAVALLGSADLSLRSRRTLRCRGLSGLERMMGLNSILQHPGRDLMSERRSVAVRASPIQLVSDL